jgi:hypothetical protein
MEHISDASTGDANLATGGSWLAVDAEDKFITRLDEQKMSSQKLLVTRFLTFLKEKNLDMAKLQALPKDRQAEIKTEFLEG